MLANGSAQRVVKQVERENITHWRQTRFNANRLFSFDKFSTEFIRADCDFNGMIFFVGYDAQVLKPTICRPP